MMFLVASIAIFIAMAIGIARSLLGPSIYDRILAINSVGTKVVLFIALHGFLTDRPDFIDLALLYALLNTLGTVAVLKFVERAFPTQKYIDGSAK